MKSQPDRIDEIFAFISRTVHHAPANLRQEIEARAGISFPLDLMIGTCTFPTYESLEAVDRALAPFLDDCFDEMNDLCRNSGLELAQARERIARARPFRVTITPEYIICGNDRGLMAVPCFLSQGRETRYHTLGEAVIEGAIQASVFLGPVRVRVDNNGNHADYSVTVYDGKTLSPARHATEISKSGVDPARNGEPVSVSGLERVIAGFDL